MLTNPTLDKLRELKLTGMAEAFCEQLQKPMPDLDFESRLGFSIEREWYLRDNRRLNRRLQQATLNQQLQHLALQKQIWKTSFYEVKKK